MHGLAVFEHHVVADIDDVVDRAQTHGGEATLDKLGRRAYLHAGDHGGGVERAVLRCFDAHGFQQVVARGGRAGVVDGAQIQGDGGRGRDADAHLRVTKLLFEPRGEFARDAEVTERVGAVGRDLDVEHDIAGRQDVVDRRADRRFAGEQEQTLRVLGEGEFLGRAHHAGGGLAAHLGFFDDEVAGQHRARDGDGHAIAGIAVGRATHDGAHAAVGLADIDGADGKLVGVGVLVAGEDVADDDVVEGGRAGADDLLDLKAEEGDSAGDVVVGDTGEINVVLEPGAGNFHEKWGLCFKPRRTRRARRGGNQERLFSVLLSVSCVVSVVNQDYFRRTASGSGRRFDKNSGCHRCRRAAWRGAPDPCRRRSRSRPRGHSRRP